MSRRTSEADRRRRRRARRSPAVVCRAGCVQPGGLRAFRLSRRGGGLVGAREGCLERSSTFGHQVFTPLGKQAKHLRVGLGIDRCLSGPIRKFFDAPYRSCKTEEDKDFAGNLIAHTRESINEIELRTTKRDEDGSGSRTERQELRRLVVQRTQER
jgi:hypothetical protein